MVSDTMAFATYQFDVAIIHISSSFVGLYRSALAIYPDIPWRETAVACDQSGAAVG
jgi:hypothetical protein